jgi:hypothetical protein
VVDVATPEPVDPGITPEQLLEIEDRHKREWPRLGWFEHGDSNADVHRLISVIRKLTGWERPDPKFFEKRLGAVANVAVPKGRKKP